MDNKINQKIIIFSRIYNKINFPLNRGLRINSINHNLSKKLANKQKKLKKRLNLQKRLCNYYKKNLYKRILMILKWKIKTRNKHIRINNHKKKKMMIGNRCITKMEVLD